MPLFEKFMDELLTFPSSKHDDMVDAFTFALTKREDILRVANRYRRPKRKHLSEVAAGAAQVSIYTVGGPSVRDKYFARTGRGVFSGVSRRRR